MRTHSFATSSANKTFGQFKEPTNAGSYVLNKKANATFCRANACTPSITVNTQGNLLLLRNANRLKYYNCANSFNKANLNINLLTKLDLTNVTVVEPVTQQIFPIPSTPSPYLEYIIDPTGALFGNTLCGINRYVSYMVYNPPNAFPVPNPPVPIPVPVPPVPE